MSTELQWRRRWKPDLRASPWKPMQIDGNTYLVKCRFAGESYELLLTDLTTMWVERLGEVTLKKRIKKLNPSLEAQTTKILDHIQSNIESTNSETTFSVGFRSGEGDGDAESVRLTVNSKLAGMPFLWHFDGSPVDRDVLSEHLTMPLLAMVGELFRRQQELIKVVTRKDKEIADYKAQGVKTSRKHIETLLFDETAFGHDMVTSQGFEEEVRRLGVGAFTEGGQHLYRDIMTKHAWVTRSPSAGDDTSDSLSDETSLDPAAPSSGSTSWGNNRLPPSLLQSTPSPRVSPQKSPGKSSTSTPDTSPTKDTEMLRRQALEKRLLEEEAKKEIKARKKKKIGF